MDHAPVCDVRAHGISMHKSTPNLHVHSVSLELLHSIISPLIRTQNTSWNDKT